jgi:RNA polymerase sigma factor (sigma-70 family)
MSGRPCTELESLVSAAANGDQAAWTTIVSRFRGRVTRAVRSFRIPAHDVDDVVQLTFIRLHHSVGSLRDPNALAGWLDTTARRETLRSIRATLRERPLDVVVLEDLPAPVEREEGLGDELRAELDRALDRLSPRQRTLLRALGDEREPSYEEVAARLGMPLGSVGPTRGRALQHLRTNPTLRAARAADIDSELDTGESHVPYWRPATVGASA